jgi:ABC-type amino acid transport substrate-binding protein
MNKQWINGMRLFWFMIFAILVIGCNNNPEVENNFPLHTMNDGILKVGIAFDYNPYEYFENGVKKGFDIDLLNAISQKTDVSIEYIEIANWDDKFSMLENNEFDCIISSLSITEDRKKYCDFSDPYLEFDLTVLTKDDSITGINNTMNGKTIAVTHYKDAFENLYPNISITWEIKSENEDCINSLNSNEVDMILCETPYIAYNSLFSNYIYYRTNSINDQLGIGIKKGNSNLKKEFNYILQNLVDEGILQDLSDKYFGKNFITWL